MSRDLDVGAMAASLEASDPGPYEEWTSLSVSDAIEAGLGMEPGFCPVAVWRDIDGDVTGYLLTTPCHGRDHLMAAEFDTDDDAGQFAVNIARALGVLGIPFPQEATA